MNRNFFPKRKCRSSPVAFNVPVIRRAPGCNETARNRQGTEGETSPRRISIKTRVIVSISTDLEFDRRLRMLAMQSGQIVIRVESMEDARRIVDADCCGIILLDLDSIGRTALEMAGDLLQEPLCPPVILLTGKGQQHDLRMTVFAGSVLEKSCDTFRILKLMKTILEGWPVGAERFPSQRGMMREESGGEPTKRFWDVDL
jgi:CheY-like chemotaxis protein